MMRKQIHNETTPGHGMMAGTKARCRAGSLRTCGAGGYLLMDVTIALAVLAVLMVSLSVMINRHNNAAAGLAQRRAAQRVAEQAMLALQNPATPMPAANDATQVTVQAIEGGATVPGRVWAQVRVRHGRGEAAIVGLVDAKRIAAASGDAKAGEEAGDKMGEKAGEP